MVHCEILIIDDDKDDIEFLTEALYKSGVDKVHFVYSAKEAFEYLKEVYPDCIPKVIVSDLFLPAVTGAEFLTDLKSMDQYKEVKVVVLSSAKPDHQIDKLYKFGDFHFLIKPSNFNGYMDIAMNIKKIIA